MDIGSILTSLCCGCWIVPLVAIGVIFGISSSIRHAWHSRGIERDGMYCARCKFDVRGATGEKCPECGAYLLESATARKPRGGIVVEGVDPPMSLGVRELTYLFAGFAPIVAGVIMLGLLLPINYQHTAWVHLTPTDHTGYDSLHFSIDSERSWLGTKEFSELNCWQANYATVQAFNDAEPPSEAQAEKIWRDMMSNFPDLIAEEDRDARRDEFVAVLLAASAFDSEQARSELKGFEMTWEDETEPSLHPLYILFSFIVVIGGIIFLILGALREHASAMKEFNEGVEAVQQRYRGMLAKNRPADPGT